MAEIVRMPAVMAEATHAVLLEWLTEPGAHIAVGDLLAEIETDKAVVDYAAEIEGTIGRLLVSPGEDVTVGDPIAVVLGPDEDAASLALDEEAGTAAIEEPAPASAPAPAPSPADRLIASPVAKRVAAERGIDLGLVPGSGPNGRIVRRDVEAHTPGPAATAPRVPTTATATTTVATTTTVAGATVAAGGFTDVPLTGMRRAIARRLTESKTSVPHFYVTAHVRVGRLLTLRQEVNGVGARRVSVNDFIVKAVASALVDVPAANAIWNGDSIRRFEDVDVAVAVAVPDGLLTPVVRRASSLGLAALSAEISELAERARAGRLQQHELEGGSFSVSNLGMYGVHEFSAILNPPQAGILAVSAAKPQPVVEARGELAVDMVMTVTLSADHRVIDGAVAAEWMAALVSRLEKPLSLLL